MFLREYIEVVFYKTSSSLPLNNYILDDFCISFDKFFSFINCNEAI